MGVGKQNKYSESYIEGLDLVSEELVKFKKELEKNENIISKNVMRD